MKFRTLIFILFMVAVVFLASPALREKALPIVEETANEIYRLVRCTSAPQDILKVENRFMVRSKSGTLIPETSSHIENAAYPDTFSWQATTPVTLNNHTYFLWDENVLSGAVDKFLIVENKGDLPLFFRTYIAMSISSLQQSLVINRNTEDYLWTDGLQITVNDEPYMMYVASAKKVLHAHESAPASLLQLALKKNAVSANVVPFTILIHTQTISANGFDTENALQALDNVIPISTVDHPFR